MSTRRPTALPAALVAGLWLTCGVIVAGGTPDSGCGAGETKTDQGCVRKPELRHGAEPDYPPAARKAHAEGKVTLQGIVNVKGRVEEIKVLTSSATDTTFTASFEEAATVAWAECRYRPGTVDGAPAPMEITFTFDFRLRH